MSGGGLPARGGFEFQDLVLGVRVVTYLSAQLAAKLHGTAQPAEPEFYAESRPTSSFGSAGPDWDLVVESAPGTWIFEEVKEGAFGKADRTTLWIRLRKTAEAYGADGIVPQLTLNRENLPAGIEHLRGLAAAAPTATRPTSLPSGNVTSASKLAGEALFWLTRPSSKKVPGAPLSTRDARALLARFKLNESSDRDALRTHLESDLAKLTRSIGADVVLNAFTGELAQRAANPNEAARHFRPTDLLAGLQLLSVLLRSSAAAIHLWADLNARPAQLPSNVPSPLAYQEWRHVQPQAAAAVDSGLHQRLALVGRGGVGKSVLLEHLAAEESARGRRCVLVDGAMLRASAPATIAEALALGRFAAAHQGFQLSVVIDSLESSANASGDLAAVVAALGRVEPDVSIIVSTRLAEWRGLSIGDSSPPGWSEASIAEWSVSLVQKLVVTAARPVSEELVRLLGTPLFLDLFLRLFGKDKPVPAGLQTRHGLLREYWDQRILPDDHPEAPARRRVLDQAASEEAGGREVHSLPLEEATDRLVSEGIFRIRRGSHVFRHALLRDYALMGWLLLTSNRAPDVAARIASIPRLLVRMGSLRAVLEALAEGESWPLAGAEVAQAISAHDDLRLLTAEAFAELDDPSTTDLLTLVRALGTGGSSFFERLVEVASLRGMRAWAQLLTGLPATADFAEAETWIAGRGIELVSKFAETVDEMTLGAGLGRLVRAWSQAARLQAHLDANDGWLRARVIRVVVARVPDMTTFEWVAPLGAGSWRVRVAIIDALPTLAADPAIDAERIRTLFLGAAKIEDTEGRLRHAAPEDAWQFDNALRALVGNGKTAGLLTARPDVMLSVALGLLAGRARARAADAVEQGSLDQVLRGLPDHQYDDEDRALEKNAPPRLTPSEAFGALAIDVEDAISVRLDPTWAMLVAQIRDRAEHATAVEVDGMVDVVDQSVSLLGRLIVLHAATARLAETGFAHVVDRLLADNRIYFFRSAAFVVHAALHARWPQWNEGARQEALGRLRRVIQRPSRTRIYDVAPLLVAIPEPDWPEDLRPFGESHRRRFGDPTPRDPNRTRVRSYSRAVPADELFDLSLPAGTLSDTKRAAWRALEQAITLVQQQPAEQQTVPASEPLLIAVEAAVQALPTQTDPDGAVTWCASRLLSAVGVLRERGVNIAPRVMEAATTWCTAAIHAFDTGAIHADRAPVGQGIVSTRASSPFEAVLWLASELFLGFSEPGLAAFWNSLDALVGDDPAPWVVRSLATHFSEPLGTTERGRRLFRTVCSAAADGDALAWTMPVVAMLTDADQAQVIQSWIGRTPALAPPETMLSDRLGEWVVSGGRAVAALRDKLLVARPAGGFLSTGPAYRNFLGGVAHGCALLLEHGADAKRIAKIASASWSALNQTTPEPGERAPNFALIVFRALDSQPATRAAEIWRELSQLAQSILATGALDDVADLLFGLNEARVLTAIGARDLLPVGDALASRLAQPTDVGRDAAIVLPQRACRFVRWLGSDSQLTEVERERMLLALQTWSAPPLDWPDAVREAIRVRQSLA